MEEVILCTSSSIMLYSVLVQYLENFFYYVCSNWPLDIPNIGTLNVSHCVVMQLDPIHWFELTSLVSVPQKCICNVCFWILISLGFEFLYYMYAGDCVVNSWHWIWITALTIISGLLILAVSCLLSFCGSITKRLAVSAANRNPKAQKMIHAYYWNYLIRLIGSYTDAWVVSVIILLALFSIC